MKKLICLLAIVATAFAAQAQITNIDSLVNVLNTQSLKPDKKFELYWDIISYYWATDADKTILYAKEAFNLAEKENNDKWLSKYSRAMGIAYSSKDEYEMSIELLRKAINFAEKSGDKQEESAAYATIGVTYRRMGNTELALKYFIEVLPILEQTEQWSQYANTLGNIASIHLSLHHIEKALEYYRQSLVIAEKHDLQRVKMYNNAPIGKIFNDMGQIDSAVVYVRKSYEISRVLNDNRYRVIYTQMLAGMYADLKDYGQAEKYAQECLDTATELEDQEKLLTAWSILAKVSFDMKRYKECDMFASKVWGVDSTDIDNTENATTYLCCANIFLGNQEKANYFFDQYRLIRDAQNNESLNQVVGEMEVKYETEKKELRITALEKEQKLYIWLGVAGGVVLLLAIGMFVYRNRLNSQKRKVAEQQREMAEQKQQMAEQQVKQLEQEKQLIAAQALIDGETAERTRLARDLHDGLGGMLSVVKLNLKDVKGLGVMDGADAERFGTALDVLDQSIGELRRVAHHIMPDSLVRYGLRVSLEDFCRAIPGATFQYYGNDARLDSRLEVLIYRCAHELVNNAVKHAGTTVINVQLMADEGLVSLTVADNGRGFDTGAVTTGTGLENIRTRVSAYNGRLNIVSSPGKGTEVSVEIERSEEI